MRRIAMVPFLLIFSLRALAAVDAKADEIIAKSLDSIGTSAARDAIETQVVQGPLQFKDLVGKLGEQSGNWGFVSERYKTNLVMKFGSGEWHGERFVRDGKKTSLAVVTSSRRPSAFGDFIRWQDFILTEGLLGGELSAAWALNNLDRGKTRIEYVGIKKLDQQELDAIEYHPKGTDMNITLYFDPSTHYHVATIYKLRWEPGIGRGPSESANRVEIRYTMEERFSDFQTDQGITLPRHYELRYTQEPQGASANEYVWEMTAEKIFTNVNLDPRNFEIKYGQSKAKWV